MNFNLRIFRDDEKKGAYMVVITDEESKIVGVPVRGITKDVARSMIRPLKYAFEYGFLQAQACIQRHVWDLSVSTETDECVR